MKYNPFKAAMSRNHVYADGKNTAENRDKLRAALSRCAGRIIAKSKYEDGGVKDKKHYANIEELARRVSDECRKFLRGKRFRIGTAQKYLNMELKKMWREGSMKTPPPHCPFDKGIIDALPQEELRDVCCQWTKSDDIADYKAWVEAFRSDSENLCAPFGLRGKKATMAAWEFHYWKSSDKKRSALLKRYKKVRRKKA